MKFSKTVTGSGKTDQLAQAMRSIYQMIEQRIAYAL